ncbi:MAG: aminotransferase class I/II-fold pyridoxal phosphate-dependent enzyme [Gammaproteobacteria bacterium]|nr:aminotransferase class I/II-fold pyridoxal phosphate-dependent enzyme [Gammaproteobacteria bacterium]
MKHTVEDLGVFGGRTIFPAARPIGQLALPNREAFFRLVAGVYARRRITNNGPLVQKLERRLAQLHQVRHCIAVANASLGLILLMQALARHAGGEVIMPAFTYAGLPHLAQWAGLRPRFCDVEARSHALDPACAAAAIDDGTALILAVHQVNSPCFITEFEQLSRDTGVPLVFDSVHGARCSFQGRPIGGFGRAEVFSLHATKLLNGFEGGYITTSDDMLADLLRRQRNFGYVDEAATAGIGLNAKLNELHAAAALSCLDDLDALVQRNQRRYELYRAAFAGISGLDCVRYADNGERWNYEFFLLEVTDAFPLSRNQIVTVLRAEQALARPYYSPPLHLSQHCPAFIDPPSLPVTETLSRRFIQMPVGETLQPEDISALADLFRFMQGNAAAIRPRLEAAG